MGTASNSTDLFFTNTDLDLPTTISLVKDGLVGADFGEFYREITANESINKTMGKYQAISAGNSSEGFGFRVGQRETIGYAYSDIFNRAALSDAIAKARQSLDPAVTPFQLTAQFGRSTVDFYPQIDPMAEMSLEEKIAAIDAIDAYARSISPRITNVTIEYRATSKSVFIITPDGTTLVDARPDARIFIAVQVQDEEGKTESVYEGVGGRTTCRETFNLDACKKAVDEAYKTAEILLKAENAPAGTMDVVMAPGWGALILHEAVGHGFEGDFNRRNTSVYSGKIGQQVASPVVTVIDQGNLPGERGSIHFDDEGTAPQQNILIENGILMGYMQDRQNAQLMGVAPTGNGRRESFKHAPMPRMTNTYFANGTHTPEEIIASVKDGIYVDKMSDGEVDTVSGKFMMNVTLAWRIRDGKLCEPLKKATLTGFGHEVLKTIKMVGNDLCLERTYGMCGKNGQSVVVGCGQPTLRVADMTVGGNG